MSAGFRLAALALTAALLCLSLKKQSPELALGLSLCALALGGALLLDALRPLLRPAPPPAGRSWRASLRPPSGAAWVWAC